jgi:hypothetical protein
MKTRFLATALVLLAAFAATGRADEFSDLAHAPGAYWVPPAATYAPPPGYYGNPPPVIFYAPGPPPPPAFYFHFHFH